MQQRLIGAAVLVPVFVIVFLLGDPWLTFGIAALAGLAALETSRLVRSAGLLADTAFAVIVAVGSTLLIRWSLPSHGCFAACEAMGPSRGDVAAIAFAIVALVVVVSGVVALRHSEPRDGFRSWVGNVFAALYPGLLGFLVGILMVAPTIPDTAALGMKLDAGRTWMVILVLTVWSFDTFAYVAGKYHGRGRFMNHISPNKTWSGVVGGTTAALLVCTFLAWGAGQQPLGGLLLGFLIAVTATAGDLAESVLKRAAGAKDSGNIIPGHGGILDRVDSFLFAAPAMFVAITLGRIVLGGSQ